jgi:HEAT repeat protein
VVTALLSALQDTNEQVRVRVAVALSNATSQPEVVTALLNALQDTNEQVRVYAAHALGEMVPKSTTRVLQDMLVTWGLSLATN